MITSGTTMTLCLSEIEGFESLTARMPTADERAGMGIPDGAPVLVMRHRGHDQVYRADMITVTIDTTPPPDPDGTREAARTILNHVIEDIGTAADDLTAFARALAQGPRRLAELAGDMLGERAEERAAYAALESGRLTDPNAQEDDRDQ